MWNRNKHLCIITLILSDFIFSLFNGIIITFPFCLCRTVSITIVAFYLSLQRLGQNLFLVFLFAPLPVMESFDVSSPYNNVTIILSMQFFSFLKLIKITF